MEGLRAARKAAGLTQQKLADLIGVERVTLAAWETGRNPAPSTAIKAIASVLGCTIDELFEEKETEE